MGALVESAKIYYSSGFFLTVSPDSMIKVAEHAGNHGKHFAMNLSAPFLAQFFKDPMLKVMAHADIVFGNETEADEFAKKIAALPLVSSGSAPRSRLVVITQGADPVIVVQNGEVTLYDVTKLAADKIVDTNGAGDAFVGGFLAQLTFGLLLKSFNNLDVLVPLTKNTL